MYGVYVCVKDIAPFMCNYEQIVVQLSLHTRKSSRSISNHQHVHALLFNLCNSSNRQSCKYSTSYINIPNVQGANANKYDSAPCKTTQRQTKEVQSAGTENT